MKKVLSVALFAVIVSSLGASALVSPASGATVSYTASIPSQLTDLWNAPLNFTDFNPALGTLTGVSISLAATVDTYFHVAGAPGTSFRLRLPYYSDYSDLGTASPLNLPFSLTLGDNGGRITGGPHISTNLDPVASKGGGGFSYFNSTSGMGPYLQWTGTIPGSGSISTPTFTTSATSQSSYSDAAFLTELTGSGFTPLYVNTATYTIMSGGSGYTMGQTTHAGVEGSITYYYTPVPLPPAILLLAPGLVGLVTIRRRFKR